MRRHLVISLTVVAALAVPLVLDEVPAAAENRAGLDRDLTKAERRQAEQEAIRQAVLRGEIVPLPKVLAIAQGRVEGEIIKVELENESWGIKYEVKILTPTGRVREVEINARTGKVLKVEDD